MNDAVTNLIAWIAQTLSPLGPITSIDVSALASITLVCISCGLVGSLVVGNRMAFFSDAMAHTAFAGVATGLIGILIFAQPASARAAEQYLWLVPLVTIVVGVLVGSAMEFVRERTGLTNDTVIGVFFAAAIGFAVTVIPSVKRKTGIDPDQFLFGSPLYVRPEELVMLFILAIVVFAVIVWRYNTMAFGVISPPLARSRGISIRLGNYLFIVLLALVVNVSIKAVGVLLMNAILIVPAAAAINIASNARQMFRYTLILSLISGWLGYFISVNWEVPISSNERLALAPGGTIVLTAVTLFFVTMFLGAFRRRFGFDRPASRAGHVHKDGDLQGCCG
ncbi:MAG: metal ABC transporter permease [Gemmataceae bacterium]